MSYWTNQRYDDMLLSSAQRIALRKHRGGTVTAAEQATLDAAFEQYGPEGVYMDGELFCDH